ncbi:hypothetical protein PC9H_007603 [Pleurotus ostreatus]|uniref:C2H2-type domain-containing protein n=1 Tax=Pleurotus ostreatus TaxID=5322 RepID=A0A8H6ZRF2_PLEOS|nr:uncharacterized protein PC9H_007603 [Pleurotus ostreatus]KAF7428380.1 hypothetical protein PC9H_007603 [Pleurotus ostreatus]
MSHSDLSQPLFTCLSCSIAFPTAEDQRVHYRSDHHRYNMKRRVASLPPVSAAVFAQKLQERQQESTATAGQLTCEICNKTYTTEGAYRSHVNSKRHKEIEAKVAAGALPRPAEHKTKSPASPSAASQSTPEEGEDGAEKPEEDREIDAKISAAAGKTLSPSDCLFCTNSAASFEGNLTHMSTAHSFFVPDADYLTDLTGLVAYLAEKIVVGNFCIYCNEKGRDFRTLEAARKHMIDKGHCKIAYDTEDDRLEISDYYDFSSSYPPEGDGEEWEDVDADGNGDNDDDMEVDEVVDDSESETNESNKGRITYSDSDYELVLPSGARIGHRSMRRYYAQSFTPIPGRKGEDPNSGAALVRRLLADKNSALVPRKGGFGAYGSGTDVIKARNRGEAREAGRHVREFRDQKRREDFKTKVGYRHNSQKHFRDPRKHLHFLHGS